MKTLLPFLLAAALLTAGCEDRYRYACQDPANWENEECKRPQCEADGVCPDMLLGKPVESGAVEPVESGESCSCAEEEPQGE